MISTWHDRKIPAGSEIDSAIDEHLRTADVILLLISSAFIASDYCWSKELKMAIERHKAGEATVIPIILRDCDWKQAPFASLRALPTDGRPVVSRFWKNADEAFADVSKGLRDTLDGIDGRRSSVTAPRVAIVSPIDDSYVPLRPLVAGSVTDPSAHVWVIVHPESNDGYWVQPPVTVEENGSWSTRVYIGREGGLDVGAVFEIRAVAGSDLDFQEGQILSGWPQLKMASRIVRVHRARG